MDVRECTVSSKPSRKDTLDIAQPFESKVKTINPLATRRVLDEILRAHAITSNIAHAAAEIAAARDATMFKEYEGPDDVRVLMFVLDRFALKGGRPMWEYSRETLKVMTQLVNTASPTLRRRVRVWARDDLDCTSSPFEVLMDACPSACCLGTRSKRRARRREPTGATSSSTENTTTLTNLLAARLNAPSHLRFNIQCTGAKKAAAPKVQAAVDKLGDARVLYAAPGQSCVGSPNVWHTANHVKIQPLDIGECPVGVDWGPELDSALWMQYARKFQWRWHRAVEDVAVASAGAKAGAGAGAAAGGVQAGPAATLVDDIATLAQAVRLSAQDKGAAHVLDGGKRRLHDVLVHSLTTAASKNLMGTFNVLTMQDDNKLLRRLEIINVFPPIRNQWVRVQRRGYLEHLHNAGVCGVTWFKYRHEMLALSALFHHSGRVCKHEAEDGYMYGVEVARKYRRDWAAVKAKLAASEFRESGPLDADMASDGAMLCVYTVTVTLPRHYAQAVFASSAPTSKLRVLFERLVSADAAPNMARLRAGPLSLWCRLRGSSTPDVVRRLRRGAELAVGVVPCWETLSAAQQGKVARMLRQAFMCDVLVTDAGVCIATTTAAKASISLSALVLDSGAQGVLYVVYAANGHHARPAPSCPTCASCIPPTVRSIHKEHFAAQGATNAGTVLVASQVEVLGELLDGMQAGRDRLPLLDVFVEPWLPPTGWPQPSHLPYSVGDSSDITLLVPTRPPRDGRCDVLATMLAKDADSVDIGADESSSPSLCEHEFASAVAAWLLHGARWNLRSSAMRSHVMRPAGRLVPPHRPQVDMLWRSMSQAREDSHVSVHDLRKTDTQCGASTVLAQVAFKATSRGWHVMCTVGRVPAFEVIHAELVKVGKRANLAVVVDDVLDDNYRAWYHMDVIPPNGSKIAIVRAVGPQPASKQPGHVVCEVHRELELSARVDVLGFMAQVADDAPDCRLPPHWDDKMAKLGRIRGLTLAQAAMCVFHDADVASTSVYIRDMQKTAPQDAWKCLQSVALFAIAHRPCKSFVLTPGEGTWAFLVAPSKLIQAPLDVVRLLRPRRSMRFGLMVELRFCEMAPHILGLSVVPATRRVKTCFGWAGNVSDCVRAMGERTPLDKEAYESLVFGRTFHVEPLGRLLSAVCNSAQPVGASQRPALQVVKDAAQRFLQVAANALRGDVDAEYRAAQQDYAMARVVATYHPQQKQGWQEAAALMTTPLAWAQKQRPQRIDLVHYAARCKHSAGAVQ